MSNILVVDDEESIRIVMSDIISDMGHNVDDAATAEEAINMIEAKQYSLILLDIWLQGSRLDGLELLRRIKKYYPEIMIIMISGHGTIDIAIKAIRKGAYDFIEKPFRTAPLQMAVSRALEAAQLRSENIYLRRKHFSNIPMMGVSTTIRNTLKVLDKHAKSDSRVFIAGTCDASKYSAAMYLHSNSSRYDKQLVIIPCRNMKIEISTGDIVYTPNDYNDESWLSLSEATDGGTILLDEITDISHSVQEQLIRMLTKVIPNSPRFLSSTSINISGEIRSGLMMSDLFLRLSTISVDIPSLSRRFDDIPIIAQEITRELCAEKHLQPYTLSNDILLNFQRISWPGNINQLRNTIERILLMMQKDTAYEISMKDLPKDVLFQSDMEASDTLNMDMGNNLTALPLKEAREAFEKEYLSTQIRRFAGNISKTAEFVGMERSALHRKLKILEISYARPNKTHGNTFLGSTPEAL